MQMSLDGIDADQMELLKRLEGWPQSFATIRYQTRWDFERAKCAVLGLLAAQKIVKQCDGTFRIFSAAWDAPA